MFSVINYLKLVRVYQAIIVAGNKLYNTYYRSNSILFSCYVVASPLLNVDVHFRKEKVKDLLIFSLKNKIDPRTSPLTQNFLKLTNE